MNRGYTTTFASKRILLFVYFGVWTSAGKTRKDDGGNDVGSQGVPSSGCAGLMLEMEIEQF